MKNTLLTFRILLTLMFVFFSLAGMGQTLDIGSGIQTYISLTNTTVTLSGKCELHLTATNNMMTSITPMDAMPGCIINLNSSDAWLYLDGTRPYILINSNEISRVYVNGAPAVNGSNVRVAEYGMGTVVIPQSPGYLPLTVYSGAQFGGSSNQLSLYTYYNGSTTSISGETGNVDVPFSGTVGSFILKHGYAATFALNADGSGPSRVYVAADGDIQVGALPPGLTGGVGFIRCYPWNWKPKKGWAGGDGGDALLIDAPWDYDWGAGAVSGPNCEYEPMQWGNGYNGSINGKQGSTMVFGFNEPDSSSQANMTTTQAIDDWTNLQNSGLVIGSPACTDGGTSWLNSFISGADAAGERVDVVKQHFYRCGYTASSLQSFLLSIHNSTGRHVGLTEFNNGANWTTCSQPTPAQEASTIQSFIQMMDSQPWVEGYNIYEWVQTSRMMVTNGVLTMAGTNYLNDWSPIGYVQELSGNPKWFLPVNGGVGSTNASYAFNGNGFDGSGNNNDALVSGSQTYLTSGTTPALELDGIHDCVVLPPNVGNSANFTFAAWVYWSGGANWQRIFDFGFDNNQYLFLTANSGSNLRFAISRNAGNGEQRLNAPALPSGKWTHVAVTISGSTAKLYTNGVVAASTTTLTNNPSQIPLIYCFLGRSQYPSDPRFHGALASVVIDGYALTGAQIAALASSTPPPSVATPAAPTGLGATTVSSSQINLSWSASSGANSYNVKRGTVSGGPYTTIAQGGTSTSYNDAKCNAGITYYYVVSAVNASGESANSTEANATTLTSPPATPTNLHGTPGHGNVALSWLDSTWPGANSFNVKRSTVSGGPYTTIATGVTTTSYADTGVSDYTTYYYVVSGVNAYGESANSAEISATPAIIPGNYSFEAPYTTTYTYNPSGASWAFDPNSGVTANGSAFTGGNAVAPDGWQVGFLQKTCAVSQVVSGFVPGSNYTLSFWASQRQNKGGGQAGQTIDVLVDSTPLVTGLTVPQTNANYTQYSYNFTASATSHTLYFNGTDLNGGDNTLFIDDIQISGPPSTPPPAPTGLTASAVSGSQINLAWTDTAGTGNYNVYRANVSGGPYSLVASQVTTTSFSDTGLAGGTTYYYVVTAVSSGGESAYSNEAGATTVSPISIPNYGFETPTTSSYIYNPSGGSWTFSGTSPSGSGITTNNSGFTSKNPPAPQGGQVAFIQEYGTITQTLSGFVPGISYTISFQAAQRANKTGGQLGQTWNVTVDGSAVGSFSPAQSATNYVTYSTSFTATSTSHTVGFTGTDLNGGDNTILLDAVQISAP